MDKKKLILITVGISILLVGGIGFWFWSQKMAEEQINPTLTGGQAGAQQGGLGTEVFNKTQNPLAGEIPQTNPFQVNTNPFKAQINPLNNLYKNPFR